MPSKRANRKLSSQKRSKKNFIRSSSRVLIGGAPNRNRGPKPFKPQQPKPPNEQGKKPQHQGQKFGFQNFNPGDPRAFNQQFRGQKFNPDPADPYKGMTREQRLIARSYESKRKGKSSGKTIDSLLKKIQKRMKKSFCNVKPGCSQYPTLETKEMLKDFYDQLKSMNTLIKKVNKNKEMCKSVPADRKKSGMCN